MLSISLDLSLLKLSESSSPLALQGWLISSTITFEPVGLVSEWKGKGLFWRKMREDWLMLETVVYTPRLVLSISLRRKAIMRST
jgi:hypothetical protein